MIRATALTLIASAFVPICAAQARGLDHAIKRLEQFQPADGHRVLEECRTALRTDMDIGDFEAWVRLRALLNDAARPRLVRLAVLDAVAEKADERIAGDLADLASGWVAALSTMRPDESVRADNEFGCKAQLLSRFVFLLEDAPLNEHLGSRSETIDLLQRIIVDAPIAPRAGAQAYHLIYRSRAPIERRRAAAEAIVAAHRKAQSHHPLVLKLLDRASFPRLRELVNRSEDPHSFHYGAASALAHLGDVQIKDRLKQLSEKFTPVKRNLGGILQYFAWQIEVQDPAAKLLDFIASTERLESVGSRAWAIRRAVELGIPKENIREALLEHASKVEPKEFRQQSGRVVKVWPGLPTLKAEGIELGILRADDLPEVKIPAAKPTP